MFIPFRAVLFHIRAFPVGGGGGYFAPLPYICDLSMVVYHQSGTLGVEKRRKQRTAMQEKLSEPSRHTISVVPALELTTDADIRIGRTAACNSAP